MRRLIQQDLLRSAHDCADGGLAVALAECCLGHPTKPLGAVVTLQTAGLRRDALLFGESQSRVVVSVAPSILSKVVQTATDVGVPVDVVGSVGGDVFRIELAGEKPSRATHLEVSLDHLYNRWRYGLDRALEPDRSQGWLSVSCN